MSDLEIHKMVALSTGHLTAATAQLFEDVEAAANAMNREKLPVFYPKGEWGWFVYVGEDAGEPYPDDLKAILDFARRKGCDWIMFDSDAGLVDCLPTYDW